MELEFEGYTNTSIRIKIFLPMSDVRKTLFLPLELLEHYTTVKASIIRMLEREMDSLVDQLKDGGWLGHEG